MEEKVTFYERVYNRFKKFSPEVKKGIVVGAAIIVLILGIFVGCKCNISHRDYNAALDDVENAKKQTQTAKKETEKVQQEYNSYKEKMKPYEAQQEADAKAAAEKAEAERKEAEEKAAAEKAAKEAEERAKKEAEEKAKREAEEKAAKEAEAARQSSVSTNTQNNSSSVTGVMSKDYKPKGKEPNWIEIVSYCEVQMPKVIGYDASISLDENDTKIIRTGLRYKIETDKLKFKADKSYHKAIFIIEFENENYENFKVDTAEVDGIKFR